MKMSEAREFASIVTVSNSTAGMGVDSNSSSSTGLKINNQIATENGETVIKAKVPRRILHFSDGTLEEFSSDDEDDGKIKNLNQIDPMALVDPRELTWAPYIWYQFKKAGSKALFVCDYLGEHVADFLGITSPKYQYEIEEYFRLKKEEENERKQNLEMSSWRDGEASGTWNENVAVDEQPSPQEKERY
ncbi:hypothetical protein CHUAL_010063 [Chamberlinius hualienensis]